MNNDAGVPSRQGGRATTVARAGGGEVGQSRAPGEPVTGLGRRRMLGPRARSASASALALLVIALVGCTAHPSESPTGAITTRGGLPTHSGAAPSTPAESAPTQEPLVTRDRDSWAMPLDPYRPAFNRIDSYAENLMIRGCVVDAGYPWPVPWQDLSEITVTSATFNAVGQRLFRVDIAEQWGYHLDHTETPSDVSWREFTTAVAQYNGDETFGEAISACLSDARAQVPLPSQDAQFYATALATQAHETALGAPAVTDAAARWRTCMAAEGLTDLPDDPEQMPPQELALQFGLDNEPDSTATTAEIHVAVTDARCMETSGYAEAVYDAEWAAQTAALEQHRGALEPLRRELEARRAALLQAINDLAPQSIDSK